MDVRDIALMICAVIMAILTYIIHEDGIIIRRQNKHIDDLWAHLKFLCGKENNDE